MATFEMSKFISVALLAVDCSLLSITHSPYISEVKHGVETITKFVQNLTKLQKVLH
jgi:hypothetical protein